MRARVRIFATAMCASCVLVSRLLRPAHNARAVDCPMQDCVTYDCEKVTDCWFYDPPQGMNNRWTTNEGTQKRNGFNSCYYASGCSTTCDGGKGKATGCMKGDLLAADNARWECVSTSKGDP